MRGCSTFRVLHLHFAHGFTKFHLPQLSHKKGTSAHVFHTAISHHPPNSSMHMERLSIFHSDRRAEFDQRFGLVMCVFNLIVRTKCRLQVKLVVSLRPVSFVHALFIPGSNGYSPEQRQPRISVYPAAMFSYIRVLSCTT